MKKNYIQPTIEVLKMQTTELLAGSVPSLDVDDDTIFPDDPLSRELGIGGEFDWLMDMLK